MDFAGWKHALLLYLREHMKAEYQEVIDRAEEMERVRAVLSLERGEFPRSATGVQRGWTDADQW
jgi:LytS/YehU family sensor histidine kinase